jgi:hypothetical protein
MITVPDYPTLGKLLDLWATAAFKLGEMPAAHGCYECRPTSEQMQQLFRDEQFADAFKARYPDWPSEMNRMFQGEPVQLLGIMFEVQP